MVVSGAGLLWTIYNRAAILAFDAATLRFRGANGLLYLFASWFSVGLHPLGARWVQEHLTLDPEQETFDYYRPLNLPALNIGYTMSTTTSPTCRGAACRCCARPQRRRLVPRAPVALSALAGAQAAGKSHIQDHQPHLVLTLCIRKSIVPTMSKVRASSSDRLSGATVAVVERSPAAETKGSINLRIETNTRQLIDDAAAILGKTRTEFMIETSRRQAIDVLLDRRLFYADSDRFDAFMHALDNPPAPGPKLRSLLRRVPAWQK